MYSIMKLRTFVNNCRKNVYMTQSRITLRFQQSGFANTSQEIVSNAGMFIFSINFWFSDFEKKKL